MRLLFQFSGEDYTIVQKSGGKTKFLFSVIGVMVLVILFCSFASALFFTEHLFHNAFADICVGIIWGYIVTNLYVLVLYTITPQMLPIKDRTNSSIKKWKLPSFSLMIRVFILVLLSIIIAQPINVLMLKPDSESLAYDIKILLSQDIRASIVTLIVTLIFLIPVYLKYLVRNHGEYYELLKDVNMKLILDEYKEFGVRYADLLSGKVELYHSSPISDLQVRLNKIKSISPTLHSEILQGLKTVNHSETFQKYEFWSNPPFRTIPKEQINESMSEEDFIDYIHSKNS